MAVNRNTLSGIEVDGPKTERFLKRVLIEKQRISVLSKISPEMLASSDIGSCFDYLADELLFRLDVFMAKSKKTDENTIERVLETVVVPITWWDHLKVEHAPKWFLDRWPADTRIIEARREVKNITVNTRLCPHIQMDQDRKHIEWLADFGVSD